ncbi:MAG TPA: Asp23/Gls24 family envelope stress response protein [Candidatus Limnocylindrales bacterium]|nr:Asp23/Gls24 family envelope stress response protein [Candidatus Limnocylindrales bacterium]
MPSATDSPEAKHGGSAIDARRIRQVVRSAAKSIYGVSDVVGPSWHNRLARRLKVGDQGVAVNTEPRLAVTLDIVVANGVPADKVALNVADSIRYIVARDIGRRIDELTIRVDGRPMTVNAGGSGA